MRLKFAKQCLLTATCLAALPAGASTVNTIGISDPAGDYLTSYTGSKAGDLDVISASVTYNPATDIFHFESTSNAAIGLTPSGFFILGFNRGQGTARFASSDSTLGNVLFDSVVRFNFDGSGAVNLLAPSSSATPFATGFATIQGERMIADIAGSLLPSAGFAKTAYTWNLWPRDGAATGGNFAAISDFAPDTSNFGVQVVPVPAAFWLFGSILGLFKLGALRKRLVR